MKDTSNLPTLCMLCVDMNNDGTFNANDPRPNFPWPVQHTNTRNNKKTWRINRPVPLNYEIPMDWHHMIPWNVLRDSWSALATSGCWNVLGVWLNLLLVQNAQTLLQDMQAQNLAPLDAQNTAECMCWAKWNLVEGPNNTNRTDDPGGDGFDIFHGSKFSSNVRTRSQILNQIYTLVRNWAHNAAVSSSDAKHLAQMLNNLKPYKNSPIAMFDGAAWEMVDAGRIDKYGIVAPGVGRHPTWRKLP